MAVIVITSEDRAKIKQMMADAKRDYIPWEKIKDVGVLSNKPVLKLEDRKPGTRPAVDQQIILGNCRVAFSYEEQPAGMCKHLSISIGDARRLPHPVAVEMVATEFGYPTDYLQTCMVWVEEFEPKRYAINVVEVEHG